MHGKPMHVDAVFIVGCFRGGTFIGKVHFHRLVPNQSEMAQLPLSIKRAPLQLVGIDLFGRPALKRNLVVYCGERWSKLGVRLRRQPEDI